MTHINIIAEIGVNWKTLEQAGRMLLHAKDCGADMAKFQYFREQDIRAHPKKNELLPMVMDPNIASILIGLGRTIGIQVFFTPENAECVADLEKAGNPIYKIGHNNCRSRKLLETVGRTGKNMIISIPAGDIPPWGIMRTFSLIKVTYLYCNMNYPTKDEDVTLPKFGGLYDGFSDHTQGITASIAAAARGAEIIEVHFKLDDDCIDAAVSKSPQELKELIYHVRRIEKICKS